MGVILDLFNKQFDKERAFQKGLAAGLGYLVEESGPGSYWVRHDGQKVAECFCIEDAERVAYALAKLAESEKRNDNVH